MDSAAEYSKLMLVVEEGDAGLVKELLSTRVNINEQNKAGQSALGIAVKKGYLDVATLLIDNGANIDIPNKVLSF
jgi:ankyrin repeat protein